MFEVWGLFSLLNNTYKYSKLFGKQILLQKQWSLKTINENTFSLQENLWVMIRYDGALETRHKGSEHSRVQGYKEKQANDFRNKLWTVIYSGVNCIITRMKLWVTNHLFL